MHVYEGIPNHLYDCQQKKFLIEEAKRTNRDCLERLKDIKKQLKKITFVEKPNSKRNLKKYYLITNFEKNLEKIQNHLKQINTKIKTHTKINLLFEQLMKSATFENDSINCVEDFIQELKSKDSPLKIHEQKFIKKVNKEEFAIKKDYFYDGSCDKAVQKKPREYSYLTAE